MSKKNNKHDRQGVNEELDYILQALSHHVRRKVIEVLAEEGSQTYTELMKKVGVDDSGTFGFHLRRMQKLLRKNQRGEYELSALGWKAYNLLKQLKGGNVEKVEEKEEEQAEKLIPLVISDRISFELTEEIAKAYLQRGKRLVITDVLKVVIHPMPRELFDKVVESISDVLTLYAPKTLEDIVHEKTRDVFSIKFYTRKPPRIGMDFGGAITGLVSGVVSSVVGLVAGVTSSLIGKIIPSTIKERKEELELVSDDPLPTKNIKRINVEVNGGAIELKEGVEPRLKVWKPKDGGQIANVNIGEDNIDVELESGRVELILPENKVRILELDMSGGLASISLRGIEYMKVDISGGWIRSKITTTSENPQVIISVDGGGGEVALNTEKPPKEANIELELNGGIMKLAVDTNKHTKIKTSSEVEGGIMLVRLNHKDIPPNYIEQGYEEAESKLAIRTEILGGLASINIKR